MACHLYTEPARAGLTLSQAQREVSALVNTAATTVLTNARRFGLDPATKLRDVPAEWLTTDNAKHPADASDAAPDMPAQDAAAPASPNS